MSASIEAMPPQHVVRGITVVYAIELLDLLFPRGWTRLPPGVYRAATASWLRENEAHYYSWIGRDTQRHFKEDTAVDQAKAEGKTIVLIDPLYRKTRGVGN